MRAFITVPATVANLGPGFDILAMALELQNEVRVELRPGDPLSIDPGEGAAEELHDPQANLVARAYALACHQMGRPATGAHIGCVNRIPFARGLGSSAAAGLGGVLAATAIHGGAWEEEEVLACVSRLEGHRDNAAAALLGGLVICAPGAPVARVDVSEELRAVLFMPDVELTTADARRVVAGSFSREDAVFNAARCSLFVRAIALRDHRALGAAMEDRWHQTARTALFPPLPALIAAARDAGAAGAALAGAGPSVIALCERAPELVAEALVASAREQGVSGTALISRIRNWGARIDVKV